MARRAKIVVEAKILKIYEPLIKELEYKGYTIRENSKLEIHFLSAYTPTHTQRLDNAMDRLKRYISINGSKVVSKGELSKILGVGRPTLDAWIKKRLLLVPLISRNEYGPNLKTFEIDLNEVKKKSIIIITLLVPLLRLI